MPTYKKSQVFYALCGVIRITAGFRQVMWWSSSEGWQLRPSGGPYHSPCKGDFQIPLKDLKKVMSMYWYKYALLEVRPITDIKKSGIDVIRPRRKR